MRRPAPDEGKAIRIAIAKAREWAARRIGETIGQSSAKAIR
jgi:hypothetical protein